MKSFIIKFLIFLIPILVISIPVDRVISGNLTKSKDFVSGEFLVWNDLYNGQIDDEILVYGASRAMVHFDPKVLEDSLGRTCYNMGVNGLEFRHQYLRHREYMKGTNRPEYIILSTDAMAFSAGKNRFNEDQFLPYMLFNDTYRKYLKTTNDFNFFDFYVPLFRYHGRRLAINKSIECFLNMEHAEPFRVKGYRGVDQEWNKDFDAAVETLGALDIEVDTNVIELFDNFLQECNDNDIDVILVCAPEYIEGQRFVSNREEVFEMINSYADKHKVLFLDYSDDSLCYNKGYFYNATHLNKTGAALFNQTLIKDLKSTNDLHGIWKKEGP